MNTASCSYCFKVDVDTHDGMRDGVPRLLDTFKAFGGRATFFLAFGPDNSGKAIWNVFRTKGFLKKMLRTGAPRLYGWRINSHGPSRRSGESSAAPPGPSPLLAGMRRRRAFRCKTPSDYNTPATFEERLQVIPNSTGTDRPRFRSPQLNLAWKNY